jgi:hypothetical protein
LLYRQKADRGKDGKMERLSMVIVVQKELRQSERKTTGQEKIYQIDGETVKLKEGN